MVRRNGGKKLGQRVRTVPKIFVEGEEGCLKIRLKGEKGSQKIKLEGEEERCKTSYCRG